VLGARFGTSGTNKAQATFRSRNQGASVSVSLLVNFNAPNPRFKGAVSPVSNAPTFSRRAAVLRPVSLKRVDLSSAQFYVDLDLTTPSPSRIVRIWLALTWVNCSVFSVVGHFTSIKSTI
jgi:hypothetical protein